MVLDASKLSFSTQWGIDKILYESPTASVGVGASPGGATPTVATVTVPHTYGANVVVNLQFSRDNVNFYPMQAYAVVNTAEFVTAYAYANESNVYIRVYNFILSAQTIYYYYTIEGI